MSITQTPLFDKVCEAVEDAHLVAFDGCHKIYLALDEQEAAWFREHYEFIFQGTPDEMLETLGTWWEQSCDLRFISGVRHNAEDPNAGFTSLISQFEDQEDEEV